MRTKDQLMAMNLQLSESNQSPQWLLAMRTHQVIAVEPKVEQLKLKGNNYSVKATRSDVKIAMAAMTQV